MGNKQIFKKVLAYFSILSWSSAFPMRRHPNESTHPSCPTRGHPRPADSPLTLRHTRQPSQDQQSCLAYFGCLVTLGDRQHKSELAKSRKSPTYQRIVRKINSYYFMPLSLRVFVTPNYCGTR